MRLSRGVSLVDAMVFVDTDLASARQTPGVGLNEFKAMLTAPHRDYSRPVVTLNSLQKVCNERTKRSRRTGSVGFTT